MDIDYSKLRGVLDPSQRLMIAKEELSKFSYDDPPLLSSVYGYLGEGGDTVLMALDEQEKREMRPGGKPFLFRIQCLRDEWGEEIKPGDVVTRRIPFNRKDKQDRPVRPRDLEKAKLNGTYEGLYVQKNEYVVDDKGCIACQFQDAAYFLQNYGYNRYSKRAISQHQEYSEEPVRAPDGGMKHVRYWRFAEIRTEDYNKLQKVKKNVSRSTETGGDYERS